MITDLFRNTALAAMLVFTFATEAGVKKEKPREIDAALFIAPLNDSLNINEGTMETRFRLNYSFAENLRPETSNCTPFMFLQIYSKDGSYVREKEQGSLSVAAQQGKGSHAIKFDNNYYYSGTPPSCRYGVSISGDKENGPWILEDEWHSLAVTWKVEDAGLRMSIFLDGILYANASKILPLKESNTRPFSKDDLIGIGGLDLSPATILSYRLSNRVRTKEEITSKDPLKPDEATTFFLDGETAAKCGKFDAKEFSKMNKKGQIDTKKPGVFFGNYKIVSTPEGKAIQFYNKLSR